MHRARRQRRLVIYSLIGVLILMTVAYAAFSQSFDIKGSTKVTSNWDVKITNVTNGTPSGNAQNSKDENGNTIVPTWDKLSANVSADLYEPGDSMEYIVTITNNGSIDATLDDVILTPSNNSAVIITYSGYAKGQKLYKRGSSNSSADIKVKVEYNPAYNGGEATGESNISFNFVQSETKEVTDDTIISKDSYKLTYDCTENGGTGSQEAMFDVGANVDLSVKCTKTGSDFLGWNTDKNATSAINSYTMPSSNSTLYAIYKVNSPIIDSINTSNTETTITVVAIAHDDQAGITKYEFSKDDGATWVDNGTNGTHTFDNLTMGQAYNIKVRVTNGANVKTTSDTIEVTPNLPRATFIEYMAGSITNVEITYPEECSDGTYTCSYQKNSETVVPVNSSNLTNGKINVEFTESGTLIATVSNGTNTISSTYTVTYVAGDNVTVTETYSTPGETTFTVPATGDYYLQVWGAQGGSYNSTYAEGGKGGYSYGTITLNKGDTLYVHTGGQGDIGTETTYTTVSGGGANGGGAAGYRGGTGGGASDIRVNSDSLYARVIVAGGGGGAYSYSKTYKAAGGYGGGEIAGDGASYSSSYAAFTGKGGTQTAGGAGGTSTANYHGNAGTFGVGGNTGYKRNSTSYYSNGAGGAGWYGGGAAANYNGTSRSRAAGGGGGSGYVFTSSTSSNYPENPEGTSLSSSYQLKDAATVGGNAPFTSPDGEDETGHSGDGYVKITYDINTITNDRVTLSTGNITTNSATLTATPASGLNVTKYEFSSDNGSTWTSNGTSGTYTFTGLTHNTVYNLKVRLTTSDGKVVNTIEAKTNEIMTPTFVDTNATESVDSTITYMSGCGSTYTCTYKKNNGSAVTVSSNTQTVNFTSAGTLTATISDGTNTVSESHEVEESDVTLSFTTSKTTNSITVTDSVNAPTGVSKYEFQVDGGNWVESANNVYTFTKLSNSTSHTVNSRVTTNFGTVKTGTSSTVTLNPITLPTYKVEYNDVDDGDVTITYPSGCGSTYTCTYTKNSESPVTVTSTSAVVNYSADGELAASVSDGTNTAASSFTVTMPLGIVDDYGPKMFVVGAGDGLYQPSEGGDDTAYFYRGANPNNYLTIGSDTYRIMSIDTSGNLKVIKDTPLSPMVWDPGYSTRISGITSGGSTAGTRYSSTSTDYCYDSPGSSYDGCKSWGSSTSTLNSAGTSVVTQMPREAGSTELKDLPTYDSYINVYLNGGTYPTSSGTTTELTSWYSSNIPSNLQSKIVTHLWNVGPVKSDSSLTIAQNIGQEAAYKWSGKVGLMTATDYVRASTNSACSNVYNYNSNSTCYNNSSTHNWLYKNSYHWTMAPNSYSYASGVWYAGSNGNLGSFSAYNSNGVRPVFYLSSDIRLKGNGTADSPYYVYTEPTTSAKATLTKLGQSAVTSGDGIYDDEKGGYYYRGAAPANYVNIGSDLYRIMEIDSDGNLKVIKDTPFDLVWDPGYSTNISGITSSSSTAGTRSSSTSTDYCYASSASSYYGCKSWGSKTSTLNSSGTSTVTQMPWEAGSSTLKNLPTYDSYINVYLNGGVYPTSSGTTELTSWYSSNIPSNLQSKIVTHLWNVGPVSDSSSYTLAQNIGQEAAYKWSGKVGLMTATDYVRASTKSACSNVYNYASNSTCYSNSSTHNWLYKNSNQWTMAPYSYSGASGVWYAFLRGLLTTNSAYTSSGVRPVFYLSSDISISGTGTDSSNAFTVS